MKLNKIRNITSKDNYTETESILKLKEDTYDNQTTIQANKNCTEKYIFNVFKLCLILFVCLIFLIIIFFLVSTTSKFKRKKEDIKNFSKLTPYFSNDLNLGKQTEGKKRKRNEKKQVEIKLDKSMINAENEEKGNKIDREEFYTLFEKMKTFDINYESAVYYTVNKSADYENAAEYIYDITGMINFTLLDVVYYSNNTYTSYNEYNDIHIGFAFNDNYTFASIPSIVSILNNSYNTTFLHFHICVPKQFTFSNILKLNSLKHKNNNRSDFTFYNCHQGEIYFERHMKKDIKICDFLRLSLIEYVNNTGKLLVLDSGDIFANKDLYELYSINLGDNYYAGVLEPSAGNRRICWDQYLSNNLYINVGVVLYNVTLWKKDELYKRAFYFTLTHRKFPLPYQDIMSAINQGNVKIIDMKYNCPPLYHNQQEMKEKTNKIKEIFTYYYDQRFSPFRETLTDIINAASDPVITHCYCYGKCHLGTCRNYLMEKWEYYLNISGFRDEILERYPDALLRLKEMKGM